MHSTEAIGDVGKRKPRGGLQAPDSLWPLAALVLLFAVIIVRRAWLADDAFITLRTVDNFVNGYGLTWNPDERVQTFTHPLWLFLLIPVYFVTREPFYTTLAVSLLVSLLSVVVFCFWVARSWQGAVLGLIVLTLSRSFVDYSTSGLENPLSHLLLLVFLANYFGRSPSPRTLFSLCLVASLAAVTRLDTWLLYLPPLAYAAVELRRLPAGIRPRPTRVLAALAAGTAPLLLWLAFSVFYYGFPFPNTAYAKLNSALPAIDLIRQGLLYFLSALEYDPLLVLAVLAGVASAILSRSWPRVMVALGIMLYVLYVVRIGGDFMSGRMLTLPLTAAVALLAQMDLAKLRPASLAVLFGVVLVAGLAVPFPTPANDTRTAMSSGERSYMGGDNREIANERLIYQTATSLLSASSHDALPIHPWVDRGRELKATGADVTVEQAIGLTGYYAGPTVHIVDPLALADPLLARMPPRRKIEWRIGHFERVVPDGYLETLRTGQNALSDSNLAEYYDQLSLLTRGSLFSWQRLRAIWTLNTGRYDRLIDFERYRYPNRVRKQLSQVSTVQPEGAPWDGSQNVPFGASGLEISLPPGAASHAAEVEISLNSRKNRYEISYLLGDRVVGTQTVPESFQPAAGGLHVQTLVAPAEAVSAGFDRIRILPIDGNNTYSLGHLILR